MKNWIKRHWQWLKHPNPCCTNLKNSRVLYVTQSNIAVLKCEGCGGESIPWQVSAKTGKEWRELNPDAFEKYSAIRKTI